MNEKYSNLLSRGSIGSLKLKNRMIMSPMGTGFSNADGSATEGDFKYYEARAKGGLGMITSEVQWITTMTDPSFERLTALDTDQQMKDWRRIAETVHPYGAKICIQVSIGLGRLGFLWGSRQPVSASEIPSYYAPEVKCRALETQEVESLVGNYRRAAKRAVLAGVDAFEIHAHAGYLLDQFLTEAWNKRTDKYGGSFENRMRFITEIIQAVREEVGPKFPILVRMGVHHDWEGGRTLEEGLKICKYLEELGIDALDIDLGCYDDKQWIMPSIYSGSSCMVDYAAEVKKVVNIPVINAGTHTPETAEKALAEGKIDFAQFGRQIIADPEMPRKLKEGREEDIKPCLYCNSCLTRLYAGKPLGCAVNVEAGVEGRYPIEKAERAEQVVVIGAGPSGLEAARVAAVRGHKVVVYEKNSEAGGQLIPASKPEFKERLRAFLAWELRQLKKLGVRVIYDTEIKIDGPILKGADEIIVAVGAEPIRPRIPGIECAHEVIDAHLDPTLIKGTNIVIAGGGMTGCDAALELAMDGKEVTIVDMLPQIAAGVVEDNRSPLMLRFKKYGVKMATETTIRKFEQGRVLAQDKDGKDVEFAADTILYAFGMKPCSAFAEAIQDQYPDKTKAVGDCVEIGQMNGAVRSGYFAGWSV